MDYIQNMIDIRKDSKISQETLAKALGWSRPAIARYELRKNVPTIDYLKAFCEYYQVSADYILDLPLDCRRNPRD